MIIDKKYKSLKLFISFFFLLFLLNSCKKSNSTSYPPSSFPDSEQEQSDSIPFSHFFENEVRPANSLRCFKGAYYRKIVSSEDVWMGITGTVVIPTIIFDSSRTHPEKPGQFLDNPSIYMGGNMNGQETDVGLTWEVIRDKQGNVSKERKAFRPFFRRTSYEGQSATWITAPAEYEYYWYPGDTVQISVKVIAKGKVEFSVEGAGRSYKDVFDCAGYQFDALGEFKRVNAIDQVGNEGKPAQPTKTKVLGATWLKTFLYRMHEGHEVLVPFNRPRYTDMRCPDSKYFDIESTTETRQIGGETISISGSGF